MNDLSQAAFLFSQSVCAMIECQAMVAQNELKKQMGEYVYYNNEDFVALINKYGIGNNAALRALRGEDDIPG